VGRGVRADLAVVSGSRLRIGGFMSHFFFTVPLALYVRRALQR